jgi:hypothetical protein
LARFCCSFRSCGSLKHRIRGRRQRRDTQAQGAR